MRQQEPSGCGKTEGGAEQNRSVDHGGVDLGNRRVDQDGEEQQGVGLAKEEEVGKSSPRLEYWGGAHGAPTCVLAVRDSADLVSFLPTYL